jgi:hypothetical protein
VGRRPASCGGCIFGAGRPGRRTAPWLQRLRIYEAASSLPAEGLSGTPQQLTRTELYGGWNALSPTRWRKWLSNTSEAPCSTAAGLSDTPKQPTRTRHMLTCTAERLSGNSKRKRFKIRLGTATMVTMDTSNGAHTHAPARDRRGRPVAGLTARPPE